MHVLGLTGGIATGKTTVARCFKELGAAAIEADDVARRIVAPGHPTLAAIVCRFGNQYLQANGELDRKKLARLIFSSEKARRDLNAMMHPRMVQLIRRRLSRLRRERRTRVVVVVAAVLCEMGLDKCVDSVLALVTPRRVQMQRLKSKGMTNREAEMRINAQTPVAVLKRKARWILRTDCPLEETYQQVDAIWREITAGA